MLQLIVVPVVQPVDGVSETNVIWAPPGNPIGRVSCQVTLVALFDEGFRTTIVYVTSVSDPADVGPVFVIDRSAIGGRGVDVPHVEELFSGLGSGVSLLIVAVSKKNVPSAVPFGMLNTKLNVAVDPAGNVRMLHETVPRTFEQVNDGPLG